MNEKLETSFYTMCERYNTMLKDFYPAKGSTGFTESNQVHIFVNALTETLDDDLVVEWLEFPWIDKKQHIDAIVYSPKYKTIFYIEAKRFTMKSKIQSISNDISRILNPRPFLNRDFIKEHNLKNIKDEYIVALSDVWLETKWKKSIPNWWMSDDTDSFKNFLKVDYNIDWSEAQQYCEELKSISNYCLLMSCKKI